MIWLMGRVRNFKIRFMNFFLVFINRICWLVLLYMRVMRMFLFVYWIIGVFNCDIFRNEK